MPNVLTIDSNNGVRVSEREKAIRYKVVLSGAYVQAVRGSNVGELLTLNGASNPGFLPDALWGANGPARGYALQGPSGNSVEIIPGADGLHWLLKVFSSANNQLGAGAYDAAVLADVDFFVEFVGRAFD